MDTQSSYQERFAVVVNDEEQYSIWSADMVVPAGWRTVGVAGTRDECLGHIETVWVDMTPRSLRQATAGAQA